MNYEQAKAYLESTLTFGINLGLQRMKRLCGLLGDPQRNLRFVHIAGTNGKGSTASYCAHILAAAGQRTGLFTSPYLTRLTERIRIIDGVAGLERLGVDEACGEISHDQFARGMTLIKQAVASMLSEGLEQPTEFELLTALAFWHFARRKCDIVVLETGLGGRLDSTNIITRPVACLITALGYDHMDRLGSTMQEIASEKAGIIKKDSDVYLYDPANLNLDTEDKGQILQVMHERCREMNAVLHIVGSTNIQPKQYGLNGQVFEFRGTEYSTRLLGTTQPGNAALALSACLDLNLADIDAARSGISKTFWPGRLEILRREPPILLDGAHNPQSCQVLSQSLDLLITGKPVIFLSGVLRDKDYTAMLDAVIRPDSQYRPAAFICTSPASPRALAARELAGAVREYWARLPQTAGSGYNIPDAIVAEEQIEKAADMALRLADEMNLPLCVFGSFYLIGAIRPILLAKEAGK